MSHVARARATTASYLPRTAKVIQPAAEHELGARAPDAGRLRVAELELKVLYIFWLAPTSCRGQRGLGSRARVCMP